LLDSDYPNSECVSRIVELGLNRTMELIRLGGKIKERKFNSKSELKRST